MLLSHAQAVCLFQPGLHHPDLDSGEQAAAVGWGGVGVGSSCLGFPPSPYQGAGQLEGVQGWLGPCLCSCLGVLLREADLDSHPEPPSRLLHLNGAPQALTFCSNNGDLVLALGSRLCLVDHRLYLPTSYLLKVCSEHRWAGRGCCGQTSC